ncbi:MAG: divergent polysaccharide deacetylase family protein [Alphaproteobacteria bacterium]|nr:divergent polysaccharide deacetylase family protein [Alphaproteobacteria bacterium]
MPDQPKDNFELPPRRPSWLARYPRKFKLAATALLLFFVTVPPALIHNHVHSVAAIPATPQINIDKIALAGGNVIQTNVNAPALNSQDDRSIKLTPAPDPRVTQDTAMGSLPRIGDNGEMPWRIYARPFDIADRRPRVAIVITGLGLLRVITNEAIDDLPLAVTLAFDGQSSTVGAWIARARQDGHEVLLQVPMEPFDYPYSDPGPGTLLTSLPNSNNLSRLLAVMRRASGYVGITTVSGSRFTTDPTKFAAVLQTLRQRGLMVFDARVAPHSVITDMAREAGVPVATMTRRLGDDLAPDAITAALNDLEQTAILQGRAVGIAAATPVMLEQIQKWAKGLPKRGVALAPISAMVK